MLKTSTCFVELNSNNFLDNMTNVRKINKYVLSYYPNSYSGILIIKL